MGQFTCFGTMDPQLPVVEEDDTGEKVVVGEEEGQRAGAQMVKICGWVGWDADENHATQADYVLVNEDNDRGWAKSSQLAEYEVLHISLYNWTFGA